MEGVESERQADRIKSARACACGKHSHTHSRTHTHAHTHAESGGSAKWTHRHSRAQTEGAADSLARAWRANGTRLHSSTRTGACEREDTRSDADTEPARPRHSRKRQAHKGQGGTCQPGPRGTGPRLVPPAGTRQPCPQHGRVWNRQAQGGRHKEVGRKGRTRKQAQAHGNLVEEKLVFRVIDGAVLCGRGHDALVQPRAREPLEVLPVGVGPEDERRRVALEEHSLWSTSTGERGDSQKWQLGGARHDT